MTEHDQRQGFLGGEVGGRQIIRAGNAILLRLVLEGERHARLPQEIQVAEDGPPAHAAGVRQSLNVVPLSSLKQTDQLQQAMDSRQVHRRRGSSRGSGLQARLADAFCTARHVRRGGRPRRAVGPRLRPAASHRWPVWPRGPSAPGASRRPRAPAPAALRGAISTPLGGAGTFMPSGAPLPPSAHCRTGPATNHLRLGEAVVQVMGGVACPGPPAGVEIRLARPRPFGQVDPIILQQRTLAKWTWAIDSL